MTRKKTILVAVKTFICIATVFFGYKSILVFAKWFSHYVSQLGIAHFYVIFFPFGVIMFTLGIAFVLFITLLFVLEKINKHYKVD